MKKSGTLHEIGAVEKAGYCAIEVGNQFSWTMISTYLSVFYTDVVGLAPAIVSIILLIARVWDGINDPMMGAIAEKTNTRWGKYRPYLIFGAPFVALFSILTFTKTGATGMAAVIYAALTYICCGMAYTAVCITQGSLVNVMTRNLHTRVQLNSLRQMGNGITGLIISAIAMPLILYFGNNSTASPRGYFFTTIIFSILGAVCVMFGGIVCKERVTQEKSAATPGIRESFGYVFQNKNVLLLVLAGIFTAGAVLGRMGLLSYYFIYFIEKPEMMAPVMMVYNVCVIIAQLFVPSLIRKIGKKKGCMTAYTLQAIGLILIFLAGRDSMAMICVGSVILGLGQITPTILNSISGDIVDREEVRTGRRSDGIVYSMVSLGTKVGVAVGGAISVALLGVIGFVPNTAQSAATLQGINILTNIAWIVFLVLGALSVGFIDITDKEAEENKHILEERAAAKSEENPPRGNGHNYELAAEDTPATVAELLSNTAD